MLRIKNSNKISICILKEIINNQDKPYTIGIIGGGQLALMLTEAAKERGIKVCVQTKSRNDPGGIKADSVIEADALQIKGNKKLIQQSEKIIFENEWIKVDKLKQIGAKNFSIPSLDSLSPLVDRISQKKFIDRLNLPSPKWTTIQELKKFKNKNIDNLKFPLMAKTFKGGYDGKGNKKIKSKEELELFISQSSTEEWIVEEWVEFEKELALVGSRDIKGKIRLFPIVETFQSNKVCHWVLSPAEINHEINLFAFNIFSSIVNELDYLGVICIEFFFGKSGLLVNEIAPRTHNSGHFSIEACNSSQFDQHICISSGLNPPDIKMNCNGSLMINLLGLRKNYPMKIEDRINKLSEISEANIHWYNKSKENFGRKMGHITFLLKGTSQEKRLVEAEKIIEEVTLIWPSPHD